MIRAPHFLRVAQALALVSGFGPVVLLFTFNDLAGCSAREQHAIGVGLPPYDAYVGETDDSPSFGGGIGFSPDSTGVTGMFPPPDAGRDAPLGADTLAPGGDADADGHAEGGGPLSPPELPA